MIKMVNCEGSTNIQCCWWFIDENDNHNEKFTSSNGSENLFVTIKVRENSNGWPEFLTLKLIPPSMHNMHM